MPDNAAQPTDVLAGSIERVTFHTADAIAARLGIEPTSTIRLRTGSRAG